ncbi:hydroxyacid oxidase 1-like protein [Ramicandelaber brevisporus]|nr:hydroxyacid oxidase 1-like protein [Ramicandelaber brevisporus]
MNRPVCVDDFEPLARANMQPSAWQYYSAGADSMESLSDNERAYSRYKLMPRMLRNVASVTTETTILGNRVASPICIAPAAMQRLACPDGELATARAGAKFGTVTTLSTYSTTSIEDFAIANGQSALNGYDALRWFQIYVYENRKKSEELIKRAEAAGYKALVVTVDTPTIGRRLPDVRNKFQLPPHLSLANFSPEDGVRTGSDLAQERANTIAAANVRLSSAANQTSGGSIFDSVTSNKQGSASLAKPAEKDFGSTLNNRQDMSLNWNDIAWMRSITKMKIVLKGIMTAEDAQLAVQYGADAIAVSNHGGRQLDTVPATIDVLGEIVDAVRGSGVEVYVDGGVRRGTDVLKALALGARAVFVGRPVLWGLAVDGQRGVETVLGILQEELVLAMRLSGCRSVGEINRSLVRHQSEFPYRPRL